MKRNHIIPALILLLISLGLFILLFKQSASKRIIFPAVPQPSVKHAEKELKTISYNNSTYAYNYFSVPDLRKLSLIPNFKEKLSSFDIMAKYDCNEGINGGFYDTSDMPLGGFMTDNQALKKPVRNRLIDGFLWVKGEQANITIREPPPDAQFYLQTGPLLMVGGGVTNITINGDEYRRRSIAVMTKEGVLLFMTLYNPESVYEGPLLSETPSLLKLINKQSGLSFQDAVNLDGGSASAFYSKDITLQEFSPVGSFFCLL